LLQGQLDVIKTSAKVNQGVACRGERGPMQLYAVDSSQLTSWQEPLFSGQKVNILLLLLSSQRQTFDFLFLHGLTRSKQISYVFRHDQKKQTYSIVFLPESPTLYNHAMMRHF
jgi:hypothetical protein